MKIVLIRDGALSSGVFTDNGLKIGCLAADAAPCRGGFAENRTTVGSVIRSIRTAIHERVLMSRLAVWLGEAGFQDYSQVAHMVIDFGQMMAPIDHVAGKPTWMDHLPVVHMPVPRPDGARRTACFENKAIAMAFQHPFGSHRASGRMPE